uniref:Expressed conserved protein n=1 Tax=Echinococcus granulosus TaxID=6210 RepID=A0A068WU82_ECHGR|nr:hypothetical protein EgrG_002039600 [Echinococcus granulosus]
MAARVMHERIHSSTFITPSTHHIHAYHHFTAAIAHHPHPPTTTPPLTINDDAFTITSSKSLPFSYVFSSIIQPYHISVDSLHDFPLKSTLTKRLCPLVTCYTRDAAVSLHSVAEADEVHFAQLYLIFAGGQRSPYHYLHSKVHPEVVWTLVMRRAHKADPRRGSSGEEEVAGGSGELVACLNE